MTSSDQRHPPPAAIVDDARRRRFGLTVAQLDPTWRAPAEAPARGLPCEELIRAYAWPENTPAPQTEHPFYPQVCVDPLRAVGLNVGVLTEGRGTGIPARVRAFHSVVRLAFGRAPLLVRDLLEIEIVPLSAAYTGMSWQLGKETVRGDEDIDLTRLAGKLVVTAPLYLVGEPAQCQAVGLVVAGVDRRLIVAPLMQAVAAQRWSLVPFTPPAGLTTAKPRAAELFTVRERIRDDFLNKQLNEGFLDPDDDADGGSGPEAAARGTRWP